MRKSHISFISTCIILLGIIAVSGCASTENDNSAKIESSPLDRRIGSIVSLGNVTTSSGGTHLFKLDDGETILLKSLSIDLNDEKFKDKFVEVKGVLTYNTGDKPIMDVMNIDVIENHVADESNAPSWKTWSGDLFQINYMDDFDIKQDGSGVTFTRAALNEAVSDSPDAVANVDAKVDESKIVDDVKDSVSVVVEKKDEGKSLADKLGIKTDGSASALSLGLIESKIGRQNISAYKKGAQGDSILVYYAEDDSHIYTITFEAGDKDDHLKSENIFYGMLASFDIGSVSDNGSGDAINSRTLDVSADFPDLSETDVEVIDASTIDNFTQYKSDTFGFTVSYPDKWFFEGSSGSDSTVQRHYEFGKESLDENAADASMDLLGSPPASGKKVSYGGREFTKIVTGSVEEIYFEGKNRTYRFSGSTGNESLLLQMAASLEE